MKTVNKKYRTIEQKDTLCNIQMLYNARNKAV